LSALSLSAKQIRRERVVLVAVYRNRNKPAGLPWLWGSPWAFPMGIPMGMLWGGYGDRKSVSTAGLQTRLFFFLMTHAFIQSAYPPITLK